MIIVEIIYNLSALIAISICAGFIKEDARHPGRYLALQGFIFGTASVLGMLHPLVFSPGLIFDGRSVMISLCGLFFGPMAVSVAGGMAIVCRIWQGGVGAFTGVVTILSSALLGVVFYVLRSRGKITVSFLWLWFFGLLVHVAMLLCMFTLPPDMVLVVLKRISFPILLAYPLATVIIGKVLIDIFERKQAQEALRKAKEDAEDATRAKSEFLNNVAHDFRTPMHAIMGFSDFLQSESMTAKQKKYAGIINESSKNLLRLVEDLLDVSRMESGRLELRIAEFDLKKCVMSAVEEGRAALTGKDVELSCVIQENIPLVKGDETRFKQILNNLISNAAKYTDKGEIVVRIDEDHENCPQGKCRIRASVKDTGLGIPQDKLPRLFDAFTRFHEFEGGKTHEGEGLGLYIVKTLVDMMKGEIGVVSEEGKGSEFTVRLELEVA